MGVDAVGRARHQRAQVAPGDDLQRGHILRLDDEDLVDLVGQYLVEHADGERIALDQLVEIRKQLRARQPAVAGEHAVAAFAADGQAGPADVPGGDLEHVVVRAVVDGQGDIDGRDLDIAHDAGAADVQETVIFRLLALGQEIAGLAGGERLVIVARGLQHGVVGVVRQALHVLCVAGDGAGGVQRVPVVADARVQKQGQPCGEQQNEQHGRAMFFHLQDSPFLCVCPFGAQGPENGPCRITGR